MKQYQNHVTTLTSSSKESQTPISDNALRLQFGTWTHVIAFFAPFDDIRRAKRHLSFTPLRLDLLKVLYINLIQHMILKLS